MTYYGWLPCIAYLDFMASNQVAISLFEGPLLRVCALLVEDLVRRFALPQLLSILPETFQTGSQFTRQSHWHTKRRESCCAHIMLLRSLTETISFYVQGLLVW